MIYVAFLIVRITIPANQHLEYGIITIVLFIWKRNIMSGLYDINDHNFIAKFVVLLAQHGNSHSFIGK